jgi:hypothetical protein
MGNAMISGILFQPPNPPNPLSYVHHRSNDDDAIPSDGRTAVAAAATTTTNNNNNINPNNGNNINPNNGNNATTTTTTNNNSNNNNNNNASNTDKYVTDRERINIEKIRRQLVKNERHNISVNYVWLYADANEHSRRVRYDDDGVGIVGDGGGMGGMDAECGSHGNARWNLIPAVHITHNGNDGNDNGPGSNGIAAPGGYAKYTLLYSHGNAEDLGLISSFLSDLARLLQVDVLCYDYSGYGVGIDEDYVSEFFVGYDAEIRMWKEWRLARRTGGGGGECGVDGGVDGGEGIVGGGVGMGSVEAIARNGRTCRYTRGLFVAPMIHPRGDTGPMIVPPDNARGAYCRDDATVASSSSCATSRSRRTHSETDVPISEALPSPMGGKEEDDAHRRRVISRWLSSRHSWTVPSSSETNCYSNIHAAHHYLTNVARVPPRNVILYGKSVGSGPTCWLSQKLCRGNNGGIDRVGGDAMMRTDDDDDDDACGMANGMCSNLIESREPRAEGAYGRSSSAASSSSASVSGRSAVVGGGRGKMNATTAAAPGGVVLHSPFLSVIRVVVDFGFTTIGDLFPNVDRVGDFT